MIDKKISSNPRNASPIFSELYKRFEFWMGYLSNNKDANASSLYRHLHRNELRQHLPKCEITNVYRNFVFERVPIFFTVHRGFYLSGFHFLSFFIIMAASSFGLATRIQLAKSAILPAK
jgi:hypothetical protein